MLDKFLEDFGGFTEAYSFYNGQVELRYDPKEHAYFLIQDGKFILQKGVTTVVKILDKSNALIPWGCKMMYLKLLATVPVSTLPTGDKIVPQMSFGEFDTLAAAAKSAHKEKLEEAGEVGHAAHGWLERHIKALLAGVSSEEPLPEEPRAQNCCLAALDWMNQHNVRWICTEKKVYSREFGYAGTMDGLCIADSCHNLRCCPNVFANRVSLVDWKSSNYLYIEYLFQTAAYQQAVEEESAVTGDEQTQHIEDRWIIRLGKDDGEFEPWHIGNENFKQDWEGFLGCLKLHNTRDAVEARMKQHKDNLKAEKKAAKDAEKEAKLKIACKGSAKYKGIKPPKCNDGNPCQTCLAKYAENQVDKTKNDLV